MLLKFLVILVLLLGAYLVLAVSQSPTVLRPFAREISYSEVSVQIPQLTLEQFFHSDKSKISTLDEDKKRTLLVTGDVLLARTVNYKSVTSNNFTWPFEKIASFLRDADVTFINLENPLVEDCPLTNTGMIFCGDEKNVEGLLYAGVDVVNIANNHASNYGTKGVDSTVSVLENAGMLPVGTEGPSFMEIEGIVFAFLGYNDVDFQAGVSSAENEKIQKEIADAKGKADIVVVQFHWGNEYTKQISPRQKELAYLAVESGADLVIGNHPHWIQPVEIYKDTLIVYAHGNFVFDQEWSLKTKQGIIGKYTFYEDNLIDAQFIPVFIQDYGQVSLMGGTDKESVLLELYEESLNLNEQEEL